jgi:hypothetical protein
VTVEQGLSIMIVERGHPFDDPDGGRGSFQRARVIWLGYSPGVEWLHDEANRRLARGVEGWYYVSSDRTSAHAGAAGEVERLILEFLGAGVTAKVINDLIDFAKKRVHEHRERIRVSEPPPDFPEWELDDLLPRLRDELAGMLDIPSDRLEATGDELETQMVAATVFATRRRALDTASRSQRRRPSSLVSRRSDAVHGRRLDSDRERRRRRPDPPLRRVRGPLADGR